jgi:hypothetical protein
MNTKYVMTASAITLGVAGILLTFMPSEVSNYIGVEVNTAHQLCGQVLGALYFGFAMLNWMTKTSVIGGIYNRPIAMANFTHFFIAGLALIRVLFSHPGLPPVVWSVACIYAAFALCFTVILFRHPLAEKKPE